MDMEKIFIIDDEIQIRKSLKYVLSIAGYEVDTASGEKETLEKLDGSFDLAIVDMILENTEGFALARKIKVRCPDIEILFVSGHFKSASFLGKEVEILKKPLNIEHFLDKVKEELGGKEPSCLQNRSHKKLS